MSKDIGENFRPSDCPTREQTPSEGSGPLYHRLYTIRFRAGEEAGKRAMASLQNDPDYCSPQIIAHFEKILGREHLKKGDQFHISLTGPWDAPVKVKDVTPTSFILATMEGHLEAGSIQFRVRPEGEGRLVFEIESVARSRDAIVDFLYDKIPIARAIQTSMWQHFCETFADLCLRYEPNLSEEEIAARKREARLDVQTEKMDSETGRWRSV